MVSAHEVPQLYPLTGDPAMLTSYGDRYQGVAEAITAVARQLDLIANDEITVGESVDAMREQTTEAAAGIRLVLPRYQESAAAIRDYAVALRDAQRRAGDAIGEADQLRAELFELYNRRHNSQNELESARYAIEPVDIDDLIRSMNRVQAQIDDRESRLHAVWMNYLDADGDKNSAALAAIGRIVPAALASNDTVFDHMGSLFSDAAEVLSAVANWVESVLYDAVFLLMTIEVAVIALVTVAVAIIVIAALFLSNPVRFGWLVSATGLTWDGTVDGFIAALLVILPAVSVFLGTVLAFEALRPTPKVSRVAPYWGTRVDKVNPDTGQPYADYEYLFNNGTIMDHKGKGDATYIDIVQVYDESGEPAGWRVTLPSTQDWQFGLDGNGLGDRGAANDLGSNIALMLAPHQQAAYERMVLEAMAQAGIGADDPVMLIGFSQGGILAGSLAANPDIPYNVQAVVVAGAPIDHLEIHADISVLAFQHEGDPVHRLDGQPPRHSASWATVVAAPIGSAHSSVSYAQTAASMSGDHTVRAVVDDQSAFFSDHEVSHVYTGRED